MGKSIGPQLPPHLLPKRKRDDEADHDDQPADLPSPALPTPSSPETPKRRRILGPAPPPAPLPSSPADAPPAADSPFSSFSSESDYGDDDDDESDDDYGPALPGTAGSASNSPAPGFAAAAEALTAKASADRALMPPPPLPSRAGAPPPPSSSRRDEWMTAPPPAGSPLANLAAQDPSKHRARGFRSGGRPGGGGIGGGAAAAAGQGVSAEWTETPEEKRRRLADQVLGIGAQTAAAGPRLSAAEEMRREKQRAADELTRKRVADAERARRGASLMEQNRLRAGASDDVDDPSKRAFDYEKDVASGAAIGRPRGGGGGAGDRFGNVESRFSGGGFL